MEGGGAGFGRSSSCIHKAQAEAGELLARRSRRLTHLLPTKEAGLSPMRTSAAWISRWVGGARVAYPCRANQEHSVWRERYAQPQPASSNLSCRFLGVGGSGWVCGREVGARSARALKWMGRCSWAVGLACRDSLHVCTIHVRTTHNHAHAQTQDNPHSPQPPHPSPPPPACSGNNRSCPGPSARCRPQARAAAQRARRAGAAAHPRPPPPAPPPSRPCRCCRRSSPARLPRAAAAGLAAGPAACAARCGGAAAPPPPPRCWPGAAGTAAKTKGIVSARGVALSAGPDKVPTSGSDCTAAAGMHGFAAASCW